MQEIMNVYSLLYKTKKFPDPANYFNGRGHTKYLAELFLFRRI